MLYDDPVPPSQFTTCREYAASRKMVVVATDFDEMSAYGPGSEARPGLQAALRAAESSGAALLVHRASRLSRWLPTITALRALNIRVYATDRGYLGRKALHEEVAKAQAEAEAKSRAQQASHALMRLRKTTRRGQLTKAQRIRGVVNNLVRCDQNIQAAARHLMSLPDVASMTHEARAASLTKAVIFRVMNVRRGTSKPWDRESLRKRWSQIKEEIVLLKEGDLPGEFT